MKSLKVMIAGLFLGGCASVSHTTITHQEAKEMMQQDDIVIIDVREEDEYKEGHIENAVLIPLGTIKEGNDKLPKQSKTLLIYCRSGRRSAEAARKFSSLGYQNVYDFGGLLDWPYDIVK